VKRLFRNKTFKRVALAGTSAVLVVTLACVGLMGAWLAGIKVPVVSGATWMTVEKVGSADAAGSPDGVFFIALIGSDARPGVGGARGDALHLVGVNPATNTATMLNVPRDTCWAGGKINRAHAGDGGPRGQAQALGELTGTNVAYAVSVDFAGFQGIVDGVGGVQINVPADMDDEFSGAVFSAGPNHLDGFHALAYSRDRHDFPRGDITRSDNQGVLILAGLAQMQTEAKGPAGDFKLAALLGRHAPLDGVGLTDLYRLGRIAHKLDLTQVRNVTIPVGGGNCLPLVGDAGGLFADFRDDATLQTH
jgi:LCP family protein required for cell wall assembly